MPAPVGADEGHDLAHVGIQVDAIECAAAVRVDEAGAAHGHAFPNRRQRLAAEVVLRGQVHHGEHTAHGGDVVLETDPDPRKFLGAAPQLADHAEQDPEVPDRELPVEHHEQHVAEEEQLDDLVEDAVYPTNAHPHERLDAVPLERLAAVVAEPAPFLLVAAETLHREHVVHAFLDGARGQGAGGPGGLAASAHHGCEQGRDAEPERQDDHRHPEQFGNRRVGAQHRQRGDQEQRDRHHRGMHDLVEDLVDLRGVVEHPVDGVPDALILQSGHGQPP